jgi:O-antigen/teichoic acid export membrane protein
MQGISRQTIRRRWRALDLLGGGNQALLRGAGLAFILQVVGAGLAFLLQVLFGRWLGASGYGAYAFTIAWAGLLGVAVGLGFPTTTLRFIPAYSSSEEWARLHGMLRVSLWLTVAVGAGVAVLGAVVAVAVGTLGSGVSSEVLLGLTLVPLLALMRLQQEAIRASRRIGLAYAPALVLRPLLIIAGGALLAASNVALDSTAALAITAASIAILLVVQVIVFWRGLHPAVRAAKPAYETRAWIRVALPLLLIAGFSIVLTQTDIVMVGAFLGSHQAGLYAAASKTASLVSLVLIAVTAIAAPMISSLVAQDRHDELQELVATVAQWIFWPSLAIAVFLGILAEPVLGLFGPSFRDANWYLVVLLLGQLVNAVAGSVGYLMILSGHQRQAAWVYGWVAIAHVGFNVVGILLAGTIGAAIATAASFALWNVWLYVLVVKRLDIHSGAFWPLFARLRSGRA